MARSRDMEPNLSSEQNKSIQRFQDTLGLSTLNLLRSTLSVETDSGELGIHLVINSEWVSSQWRSKGSEAILRATLLQDPLLKAAEANLKSNGKLSVFLRFAMPAEESTELDG